MAGQVTSKLKELQSKIQLIQESTINEFDSRAFPEHQLHLRNLKCVQVEGDIIDLQLKWMSARNRAIETELYGMEPWTDRNRHKLNIIITDFKVLRNTLYKRFQRCTNGYTQLIQGLLTELLNSMRQIRWDYLKPRTPFDVRIGREQTQRDNNDIPENIIPEDPPHTPDRPPRSLLAINRLHPQTQANRKIQINPGNDNMRITFNN